MNDDSPNAESATPAAPPLVPDHELLRRIGHGSYGEVWLARNVLGAYRAVKVVRRATFDSQRPFEREFNGIKEYEPISHAPEGLVQILHVGRNDAGDCFYCVMELADDQQAGQPLNPPTYAPKTLRSELGRRGRLPFDECLSLGLSLATALERLHGQCLVHRDIKPSNIIFVGGVPKLADIGLVTNLAASRSYVGTEGYMPPEGPGTPRADLYAVGKVLYEASTGRDRQDYPELPTTLKDWPDKEATVRLNEVIGRACDPEPANRYRSATEMKADLLRLQQGQPLARRRSSALPFALAAGVVLLLAAAMSSLPHGSRLVLVRTVESPYLAQGYSTKSLVDWDGDGVPEVLSYLTGRVAVAVVDMQGRLLHQWGPSDKDILPGGPILAFESGTHEPCRLVWSWRAGTNHVLVVLQPNLLDETREGYKIRFETAASFTNLGPQGISATSLAPLKLVELNQDGRRQLLVALSSGYGHLPRGLCCFDFESRKELWCHPTSLPIFEAACLDVNGDTRLEIVCGTSAPNNHNPAVDGIDDSQSRILAFEPERGDLLWSSPPLGPALSQSRPVLARLDRSGRRGLFAYVTFSGQDNRRAAHMTDSGRIVRLDTNGTVLKTRELGAYVCGCANADLDGDGGDEILVTTSAGEVIELTPELEVLHRWRSPVRGGASRPVELVAIGALSRGEALDIAVLSRRYELGSPLYRDLPSGPLTDRLYLENRLHILDAKLRPTASYPLARSWTNVALPSGRIVDFDHARQNQLVLIADQPYLFELRPRSLLGLR